MRDILSKRKRDDELMLGVGEDSEGQEMKLLKCLSEGLPLNVAFQNRGNIYKTVSLLVAD